jgi:hypothetical protein
MTMLDLSLRSLRARPGAFAASFGSMLLSVWQRAPGAAHEHRRHAAAAAADGRRRDRTASSRRLVDRDPRHRGGLNCGTEGAGSAVRGSVAT